MICNVWCLSQMYTVQGSIKSNYEELSSLLERGGVLSEKKWSWMVSFSPIIPSTPVSPYSKPYGFGMFRLRGLEGIRWCAALVTRLTLRKTCNNVRVSVSKMYY